jgi:hypothetical protein
MKTVILNKAKFIFINLFLILYSIKILHASDIKDFQLEGISIGDNLTSHMSEDQIFEYDQKHYEKNSKFFETQLPSGKGNYDYILFHIKRKDKNFTIHLIRGANVVSNLNECMTQKKNAVLELKKLFPNEKLREGKQKHYFYKNTTQNISQFEFRNGDLVKLECTIYDKRDKEIHGNLYDLFEVSIGTKEFYDWIEKL